MFKTYYHANLPPAIRTWLNFRGLTDQTINRAFLGWNGTALTIPIFGANDDFLFFKYRKNPFSKETVSPKYWYEPGNKTTLYGLNWLPAKAEKIIFCEGEFDCLILIQNGFNALTSTGGAGTFLEEWLSIFQNAKTYICMDKDEAGKKAGTKLHRLIPNSYILNLPEQIGEHGDVTDYFLEFGDKATFKKLVSKTKYQAHPLDKIIQTGYTKLQEAKNNIPARSQSKTLLSAKQVKIETLYTGKLRRVGQVLQGQCPFHSEKTGSFTIYPKNNNFHCFGCGAHGDSIDFVMQLYNMDIKNAIHWLTK